MSLNFYRTTHIITIGFFFPTGIDLFLFLFFQLVINWRRCLYHCSLFWSCSNWNYCYSCLSFWVWLRSRSSSVFSLSPFLDSSAFTGYANQTYTTTMAVLVTAIFITDQRTNMHQAYGQIILCTVMNLESPNLQMWSSICTTRTELEALPIIMLKTQLINQQVQDRWHLEKILRNWLTTVTSKVKNDSSSQQFLGLWTAEGCKKCQYVWACCVMRVYVFMTEYQNVDLLNLQN